MYICTYIYARKRAKNISIFDFSTLYTKVTHSLLIKVLSEITHFVFKSRVRSKSGFSATSIFWTFKDLGKIFFTEKNLIEAITFLIKSCYFTFEKMVFKQDIGIPMGIDPAPFWENLFLYFLSLSMFKILFLKNQTEHTNTMLLVDS